MTPGVGVEASAPQEKFYSLFLNGLAEAMEGNHNRGQPIACQAPDGVTANGFCRVEKSIHS
jgi:hypothetical protein